MSILVTGAAGFIGSAVALCLLERGERVVGLDNVNDYYDVQLKQLRLDRLRKFGDFVFERAELSDYAHLQSISAKHGPFRKVVHLGAEAGVRHSQNFPRQVAQSNISGHLNILEICRYTDDFEHLVYASSSSIYSQDSGLPYSIAARTDRPVSVYAATKAADELISHVYSDNFDLPQTGLRYFTVYGPLGRPDMSYFLFANAICDQKPIEIFNFGDMKRDFTYIDDAVAGTIAALDRPPSRVSDGNLPFRVFNIGSDKSRPLMDMIRILEQEMSMEAIKNFVQGPKGEMLATAADLSASQELLGYSPQTSLEEGIAQFVEWHRGYRRL